MNPTTRLYSAFLWVKTGLTDSFLSLKWLSQQNIMSSLRDSFVSNASGQEPYCFHYLPGVDHNVKCRWTLNKCSWMPEARSCLDSTVKQTESPFESPRSPFQVLIWSFLSIYSTSSFRGLDYHLLFTSSTAQQMRLHPVHIFSELLFDLWTTTKLAWGLFPWAFSGFQSNVAVHRANFYQPKTNDRQQLITS